MKSPYKVSANSFIGKEWDKIASKMAVPLLELVLTYLPHLQYTEEARQDTWEIVAIKLSSFQFAQTKDERVQQILDIPILNGIFVEERYNKFMDSFIRQFFAFPGMDEEMAKKRMSSKEDFILFELYKMRGLGAETLAKLSKERFEEQQRALINSEMFTKRSYNITDGVYSEAIENTNSSEEVEDSSTEKGEPVTSTSVALAETRSQLLTKQLEILNRELEKLNKKIDLLEKENKTLLDLNHELVEEIQGRNSINERARRPSKT